MYLLDNPAAGVMLICVKNMPHRKAGATLYRHAQT